MFWLLVVIPSVIDCKHQRLSGSDRKLQCVHLSRVFFSCIKHASTSSKRRPALCISLFFSVNALCATGSYIRPELIGQLGLPLTSEQKLKAPVMLHENRTNIQGRSHSSRPHCLVFFRLDFSRVMRRALSLQRRGSTVEITIHIYAVMLGWSWLVICIKPLPGLH